MLDVEPLGKGTGQGERNKGQDKGSARMLNTIFDFKNICHLPPLLIIGLLSSRKVVENEGVRWQISMQETGFSAM